MSMLDILNKRIAAKKAANMTHLERMGASIYTQALGTTTAMFNELVHKAECCPLCGENLAKYNPALITKGEGCPMCKGKGTLDLDKKVTDTKAKPAPKKKPNNDKDEDDVDTSTVAKAKPPVGDASVMEDDADAKKPAKPFAKKPVADEDKPAAKPVVKPVAKPVGNTTNTNPSQASLDQAAPANDAPAKPVQPFQQRGGFLHEGDTPPQSGPSGSDMVQNIGAALGHRVEVNSDAQGMGVSHAAMTVHPEWNQDAIKTKIKNHLEGKGWKTEAASKDKKSVTHTSPDGHKVHVHHVGHHLVVSSEDAEGTVPKALRQAAPEVDAKGKPIKKDDPIQKEEIAEVAKPTLEEIFKADLADFVEIAKYGKLGMRHGVRHAPSKEQAHHHGMMAQHHHVQAIGSMRSTPEMDKAHADAEKAHEKAKAGKAAPGEVDAAEKAVSDAYAKSGKTPPSVAKPDEKPSLNPSGNRTGGSTNTDSSMRDGEMGIGARGAYGVRVGS